MSEAPDSRLSFCVSMIAPSGLACMKGRLAANALPFSLWRSGYNGKHILRAVPGAKYDLELDMDSSDDDLMFASGSIRGDLGEAVRLLEAFSACLQSASVPHEVLLDDAAGDLAKKWNWRWETSGT